MTSAVKVDSSDIPSIIDNLKKKPELLLGTQFKNKSICVHLQPAYFLFFGYWMWYLLWNPYIYLNAPPRGFYPSIFTHKTSSKKMMKLHLALLNTQPDLSPSQYSPRTLKLLNLHSFQQFNTVCHHTCVFSQLIQRHEIIRCHDEVFIVILPN